MLAIQLKQMTPQDIIKPLKAYINIEYCDNDVEKYEAAMQTLQQLRTDVSSVKTPSNISRHVLLRYFGQLELVESRFPISETKVKLPFTWYDSFQPRKKITQYSIKFEQAAVMFNYAALSSQQGVHEDRSNEEGLKLACKHFMQAAGGFEYIRNDLSDKLLGARTPDMTPDGLNMLSTLMIAQAQACFYEKAVKDKMKDGIKAKLANQAVDYYSSALQCTHSPTLWSVLDKSWTVHLEFQIGCLKAASQFWQSKVVKEEAQKTGSGYGEEIAWLILSEKECQNAITIAVQNKLPASLPASVQQLNKLVTQQLGIAQKDNNSIYMEIIPSFNNLKPIGKASMVKPIPISQDEVSKERGGDLFEGLIPNAVREKAKDLKEKVHSYCMKITSEGQEQSRIAKEKLSQLGLPSSIEAHESGLPESIWRQVESCQKKGLVDALEQSLLRNVSSAQDAEEKLRSIEDTIRNEESEDNSCRLQYGTAWNRSSSSSLSQNFLDDLERYRRLIHEAKMSDNLVQSRINGQDFDILTMSRTQFEAYLPQQSVNAAKVDTSILSRLLIQLGSIIQDRDNDLKALLKENDNIDAVVALVIAKDSSVDEVFLEEKSKLDPLVEKISNSYIEQIHLLEDIVEQDSFFKSARRSDEATKKREAIIKEVEQICSIFDEISSNVTEGTKFYADLNGRIDQLKQTVNDHCSARGIEKRELVLNMAQESNQSAQIASDEALAKQVADKMSMQSNDAGNTYYTPGVPPHYPFGYSTNVSSPPLSVYPGSQPMQAEQHHYYFNPPMSQPPPMYQPSANYGYSNIPPPTAVSQPLYENVQSGQNTVPYNNSQYHTSYGYQGQNMARGQMPLSYDSQYQTSQNPNQARNPGNYYNGYPSGQSTNNR